MTNEQKYKTLEERISEFQRFCDKQEGCTKCAAVNNEGKRSSCAFHWLSLEAKDEKPDPCFYCGGKVYLDDNGPTFFHIQCKCGYRSRGFARRDIAIAVHNRVARAVMAAKEVKR